MPASLFQKSWRFQVRRRLRCRCISCEIFKNDYLVVHVQTAASDILGYPYVGISSARSTLTKWTIFFSILVFINFKLILKSCTASGVYLEPYQTSMKKLLPVVFSQKRFIIDICKVLNVFNIFPLSSFGYLNEYMNILFSFWKRSAALLTWRKSKM